MNPAPLNFRQPTIIRASSSLNDDKIPNSYTIKFKQDTSEAQVNEIVDRVTSKGGQILHSFKVSMFGFSAKIFQPEDLNWIRAHEQVVDVTQNVRVKMIQPVDRKVVDM